MTTVDRRAVQELIHQIAMRISGRCPSTDLIGRSAIRMLSMELLNGLAELPSSNAQAVAWQWRNRGPDASWSACDQWAFENQDPFIEYRALCVCSGDAKEADK